MLSRNVLLLLLILLTGQVSAQAPLLESSNLDLSLGVGAEGINLKYRLGLEWDGKKGNSHINPFVDFEYGKYSYCSEPYEDSQDTIFQLFMPCGKIDEEPYVDVVVGLSFYGTKRNITESGLASHVGISYRFGIPKFKAVSIVNSWEYKYFFTKKIYVKGGPQLDFRFIKSNLDVMKFEYTPPFFRLEHQIKLGFIL